MGNINSSTDNDLELKKLALEEKAIDTWLQVKILEKETESKKAEAECKKAEAKVTVKTIDKEIKQLEVETNGSAMVMQTVLWGSLASGSGIALKMGWETYRKARCIEMAETTVGGADMKNHYAQRAGYVNYSHLLGELKDLSEHAKKRRFVGVLMSAVSIPLICYSLVKLVPARTLIKDQKGKTSKTSAPDAKSEIDKAKTGVEGH